MLIIVGEVKLFFHGICMSNLPILPKISLKGNFKLLMGFDRITMSSSVKLPDQIYNKHYILTPTESLFLSKFSI
jgi:hypothetical protein